MKRLFLRSFIVILIAVLIIGFIPVSASAVNELVLTKLGHSKTDTVTISDPALRSVTLTAPNRTSGNTIDLNTGLIVEKASSIGSVITSFEAGSVATIGDPGTPGPAVTMTVKYYKGSDTSTLYTTTYSISVVRAAMKSPTFTGTLSKSASGVMPNTETHDITFSAGDFTALYAANDGASLDAVSFEGSNLVCGTLLYSSAPFTPGTPIPLTSLSNLWFDATAAGSVSYIVRAYAGTDHSTPIGSVLLTISVSNVSVPTITGSVSKSVNTGSTVTFSASDFTSRCNLNGGTFTGVEITPTNSGYGTWYNGSSAFTGATSFTASTLGNLKFTGSATGAASFTWKISNEAGASSSGSGSVTVSSAQVNVTYTTTQNTPKTFAAADFYTRFANATGYALNYIYFTSLPYSSYGTLYYGYSSASSPGTAVSASSAFYYSSSPSISAVTFVPATGFSGTVSIPYIAMATNGTTNLTGTIQITVSGGSVNITYTTAQNTPKTFAPSDFYTPFYTATGNPLYYIYFSSLPSSSYGTLYVGYTSASSPGTAAGTSTAYFYSGSPGISAVTFVPASGFSGTVSIPYVAVATNNTTYTTGTIQITVSGSGGSAYFSDVGATYSWASQEIDYLYDLKVVNGTGNGLFSPANAITRGDFLLMLYRLMGYRTSSTANFTDVPKSSYYYDAIAAAKAHGIAIGTNNTISPTIAVTRQDAILWIYRALGVKGITVPAGSSADIANFSDKGNIASYAVNAVQALVKAGVIKGVDGKLLPTGNLSRAEMAVILTRAAKKFLTA